MITSFTVEQLIFKDIKFRRLSKICFKIFMDEQVVSLQYFKSIVWHVARQKAGGEACGLLASNNV